MDSHAGKRKQLVYDWLPFCCIWLVEKEGRIFGTNHEVKKSKGNPNLLYTFNKKALPMTLNWVLDLKFNVELSIWLILSINIIGGFYPEEKWELLTRLLW